MSKSSSKPATPTRSPSGLEDLPCNTCRWAVSQNDMLRCHANPPQLRVPYDNMASWPVVPMTGGGCRLHSGTGTV